jgi:phosphatidate cytidylyltransferase
LSPATRERLFGYEHAFDHPVTVAIVVTVAVALAVAPLVILLLARLGRVGPTQRKELMQRYRSWLILVPLIGLPILLGAAWTILGVLVLSLLCYREYARATGLFREKLISLLVVLGIFAVTFAVADHWYHFFVALFPLGVGLIAAVAVLADRPQGYIQRVALGVLGFMLFGSALGHLGYMANDRDYRPILLMLLLAVEANDVFAYITGKTFGRRKLAPHTSPNKTVGGALGALVLTTALVMVLGRYVFAGQDEMQGTLCLLTLGVIISVVGQLGDLVLSSIKRDLGLKDMGATIPGHGGLLDRFDSLLLVAPAVFHYVGYVRQVGFGLDQPLRIFTGG